MRIVIMTILALSMEVMADHIEEANLYGLSLPCSVGYELEGYLKAIDASPEAIERFNSSDLEKLEANRKMVDAVLKQCNHQ
jgi:uncharacterized protein YdbL (DUF1318 family)